MDDLWIDVNDVAQLENLSGRAVRKRISSGFYADDVIRQIDGQRARGGKVYQIHISALSPEAQACVQNGSVSAPDLQGVVFPPDSSQPQPLSCVLPGLTIPQAGDGGGNLGRTRADGVGRGRTESDGVGQVAERVVKLGDEEYWLSAEEFGKLLRMSGRHVRRRYCTEDLIRADRVRVTDEGYKLHARLLPSRALRDFYLSRGKPVPDYLKREIADVPLDSLPAAEREFLANWLGVLNAFESFHMQQGGTLEADAEQFCGFCPETTRRGLRFSVTTLLKKRRVYEREGLWGLRLQQRGGGVAADCTPEAWDWLKKLYALFNGNRTQAIEALEVKAHEMGWTIPSRWTLMRRLAALPQGIVTYYKRGKKAFDDTVLPSNLRDYESFPSMYAWVSDHHEFDLMVRYPDGSVKRPWCTVWQDMRSRKIMGIVFTDNPNTESIALCSYRAMKAHGVPGHVIIDNGKDYRSRKLSGGHHPGQRISPDEELRLRGVYDHLNITPHFANPYNAKSKPCERTFRRFEEQVCSVLPGYVGSHPKARPERLEREIQRDVLLSAEEFEGLFTRWIAEKYHTARHSGHGMRGRSPDQTHQDELLEYGYASEEHLRLLLLKIGEERTYTRNGFQLFNQRYLVDPGRHAEIVGQRCYLRYDPQNLGTLYVYSLKDEYLCEAAVDGRSQLFNDEAAVERRKRYNKTVTKAAQAQLVASQEFLREEMSPEERIGLGIEDGRYGQEGQDGRQAAAVRLIPKPRRAAAVSGDGKVVEFKQPEESAENRKAREMVRERLASLMRRKVANGGEIDEVTPEVREKIAEFFKY